MNRLLSRRLKPRQQERQAHLRGLPTGQRRLWMCGGGSRRRATWCLSLPRIHSPGSLQVHGQEAAFSQRPSRRMPAERDHPISLALGVGAPVFPTAFQAMQRWQIVKNACGSLFKPPPGQNPPRLMA